MIEALKDWYQAFKPKFLDKKVSLDTNTLVWAFKCGIGEKLFFTPEINVTGTLVVHMKLELVGASCSVWNKTEPEYLLIVSISHHGI